MITGTMKDYGTYLELRSYMPRVRCFLFRLKSIEYFLGSFNFNHFML